MGSNREEEGGAAGKYTGKIKHSIVKIYKTLGKSICWVFQYNDLGKIFGNF